MLDRAFGKRLKFLVKSAFSNPRSSPVRTTPPQAFNENFNDGVLIDARKRRGPTVRWATLPRPVYPKIVFLICLSYEGLEWPDGGSMELSGPKNDLKLILDHLNYKHADESREFFIMTDFRVDYADSSGATRSIHNIPATRHNIETLILGTMRDLKKDDSCFLFYSGHLSAEKPLFTDQQMILRQEEGVYGYEFRSWLMQSRFASTVIILAIDVSTLGSTVSFGSVNAGYCRPSTQATHSGGFLGLEYSDGITKQDETPSDDKMASLVIEISASKRDQLAFSERFDGTTHGILTWNLIQSLKVNSESRLPDLGDYLRRKCNTHWKDESGYEWQQLPQISSSRRLTGPIRLF